MTSRSHGGGGLRTSVGPGSSSIIANGGGGRLTSERDADIEGSPAPYRSSSSSAASKRLSSSSNPSSNAGYSQSRGNPTNNMSSASSTTSSSVKSPPSSRISQRKDDAIRRSVEAELSKQRSNSTRTPSAVGGYPPNYDSPNGSSVGQSSKPPPTPQRQQPQPPSQYAQPPPPAEPQRYQSPPPTQPQPEKRSGGRPKKGTVASMNPTPAIALIQTASVFEACAYMAAKRADAVLIVDTEGQLAGILTDKDIAFRVVAEEIDPRTTTLSSVMTPNPISVTDTSSAADALNRMVAGHFRHLPVTLQDDDDEDGGGGVVGVLDITKCLYDALEKLDRAYENSRKALDAVIEAGSNAASAAMKTGAPVSGSAVAMMKYADMLKRQLSGPDLAGLLAEQSSAPPVVSINDSVLEAVKRMKAGKETAALVFDADAGAGDDGLGDLAGIFTSKDLVLRVVAAGKNPGSTPVSKVMTPHPDCVTPDTPMLEALRKMHAGRYLHLPVVDANGVVEGLVDVLKLTYTTLAQLNSMPTETENDGPMWTRFWDASADFGGSEVGSYHGPRGSAVGRRPSSSYPLQALSPSPSRDMEGADDLTVFPEDSASRITGTGDASENPPEGAPSTTGSALPAIFTFKLKDLDTGKTLRILSPSKSLASLTSALVSKLGPNHPRVEGLVRGQRLSLSYIDDEGDYVHLESDEDVKEAVEMARAAGWARVMLSIDSQRVFAAGEAPVAAGSMLAKAINGMPGHVFAQSVASFSTGTTSEMGTGTGGDGTRGASTAMVLASSQQVAPDGSQLQNGAVAQRYDSFIAPVLIGSGVALVCAEVIPPQGHPIHCVGGTATFNSQFDLSGGQKRMAGVSGLVSLFLFLAVAYFSIKLVVTHAIAPWILQKLQPRFVIHFDSFGLFRRGISLSGLKFGVPLGSRSSSSSVHLSTISLDDASLSISWRRKTRRWLFVSISGLSVTLAPNLDREDPVATAKATAQQPAASGPFDPTKILPALEAIRVMLEKVGRILRIGLVHVVLWQMEVELENLTVNYTSNIEPDMTLRLNVHRSSLLATAPGSSSGTQWLNGLGDDRAGKTRNPTSRKGKSQVNGFGALVVLEKFTVELEVGGMARQILAHSVAPSTARVWHGISLVNGHLTDPAVDLVLDGWNLDLDNVLEAVETLKKHLPSPPGATGSANFGRMFSVTPVSPLASSLPGRFQFPHSDAFSANDFHSESFKALRLALLLVGIEPGEFTSSLSLTLLKCSAKLKSGSVLSNPLVRLAAEADIALPSLSICFDAAKLSMSSQWKPGAFGGLVPWFELGVSLSGLQLDVVDLAPAVSQKYETLARDRTLRMVSIQELSVQIRASLPIISEFFGEVLVKTPDTIKGHFTAHAILDSAKVIVDEDLIAIAVFLQRCNRKLNPKERNKFRDVLERVNLANRLTALSRRALDMFIVVSRVQIINPLFQLRLNSYMVQKVNVPTNAFIALQMSSITADIFSKERAEAHAASRADLHTNFDSSVHTKIELRSLSVVSWSDVSNTTSLSPPLRADRLLLLSHALLRSHVGIPETSSFDIPVSFHSRLDIGNILVDFSKTACSTVVDYAKMASSLSQVLDALASLGTDIILPEDLDIPARPSQTRVGQPSTLSAFPYEIHATVSLSQSTILLTDAQVSGVAADLQGGMFTLKIADTEGRSPIEGSHTFKTQASAEIGSFTLRAVNDVNQALLDDTLGDTVVFIKKVSVESDPSASFGELWKMMLFEARVEAEFRSIYVSLVSIVHIVKLAELLAPKDGAASKRRKTSRNVQVSVHLDVLTALLTLTNGIEIGGQVEDINVGIKTKAVVDGQVKSILLNMTRKFDDGPKIDELLTAENLRLNFVKDTAGNPALDIIIGHVAAANPDGFEMADIFDEIINLTKAVKNTAFEKLSLQSLSRISPGSTRISKNQIPQTRVQILSGILQIMDSKFESNLHRIFTVGMEEQRSRNARYKSFQKKAAAIRAQNNGVITKEIEEAWWKMMAFNSDTWITRIRETSAKRNWNHPLFTAKFKNLSGLIFTPELPCDTIEQTLHFIDPTTPFDRKYNDLIALGLVITLDEVHVQLRDIPLPLLHIPGSGSETNWTTEGLLIVAESEASDESMKIVPLSLAPLELEPVVVRRNINPVKVYTRSNTVVKSSSTIFGSWGACLEAPLADMARCFASFTRPTVDPSEPIGWWDKLRIILHGHNVINFTGGAKAFELILGGSDKAGENIIVECGQLKFSVPRWPGEKPRIINGKKVSLSEDVIGNFIGGVRLAIGVVFLTLSKPLIDGTRIETALWRNHTDIVLRTPEFAAEFSKNKVFDAYDGFRTSSLHFLIDVQSPREFFSSLSQPINYLSLTNTSLRALLSVIPLYQSPLISIPIHQGKIFTPKGTIFKPKLGRAIGSAHVTGILHPLVVSFMCESEEVCVGLRCRAEKMEVDMLLEQKPLRVRTDLIRAKTTKWTLRASEIIFTELEGRVVQPLGNANIEESMDDNEEGDIHREWFLTEDRLYSDKFTMRMIPFIWTPKASLFSDWLKKLMSIPNLQFIYFRRNADVRQADRDKNRAEHDIFDVQIKLYKDRLQTLQSSISYFLSLQSHLEYRIQVLLDDSLQPESATIIEKLSVLYEKRDIVIHEIQRCEQMLSKESPLMSSKDGPTDRTSSGALFDHRYIIHNVNLIWHKEVRNAVSQFFGIFRRGTSMKYCLSNYALKTARELVQMVANRSSRQRSGKTQARAEDKDGVMFDDQMAQDLLAHLVADLENLVVQNETYYGSSTADLVQTESSTKSKNLTNLAAYIPSTDPKSPDYISPDHHVDSDFIIQFINPQINFETNGRNDTKSLVSVILAAEHMQFRSILILDSSDDAGEFSDSAHMVKKRSIINIENAQFFTARQSDISVSNSSIDYVVSFGPLLGSNEDDLVDTDSLPSELQRISKRQHWPVWVPLECLNNLSTPTGFLRRIVEQTSAWMYRDQPNPLYAKIQHNPQSASKDTTENVDLFLIDFPHFNVSIDASQFQMLSDVIGNLLVHHEVQNVEKKNKLKKMMLALSQMEDLRDVMKTVVELQEKIRQAAALLQFSEFDQERENELRKCLHQYEDELIIIMEALNNESDLERKRDSVDIGWKLQVSANKLEWSMLLDTTKTTSQPLNPTVNPDGAQYLAQWSLNDVKFVWLYNEDQSSTTVLEVDELRLENLFNSPNSFRTWISPYIPDDRPVNFKRNKMLRLYKREMPPVAGIPVVDHLEINIFPLLLQMTRESFSQLENYFFPAKRSKKTSSKEKDVADEAKSENTSDKQTETEISSASKIRGGSARLGSEEKSAADGTVVASQAAPSEKKKKATRKSERNKGALSELKQMQLRASENQSYIYIKMPGVRHCISYKGLKEKNFEDLNMFTFAMPTLEYRNKTWSLRDVLEAVTKDAIRAVLANSAALVREKLFQRKDRPRREGQASDVSEDLQPSRLLDVPSLGVSSRGSDSSLLSREKEEETGSMKDGKSGHRALFRRGMK
ncbi:golgi-body localization protein domain-containing protein [Zopfochytrium polystomum]|nr:golgi-body localization protein domain-containing protein [Zopfochytrium polystomum]